MGSAMMITQTSYSICFLLSLVTVACAHYNSPSTPPVYKSPVHKPTPLIPISIPSAHKPTLPPPKPTLPPPVYTPSFHKPTLPSPVYTPPAYKPTLSPPIYTPPVYKPTLSPPVYTKPTLSPPVYKPTLPPPTYTPPTKPYVPEILKAVDGIILCKNGKETYPIQGAKAKIICSEPGSYGKSKNEVVIYTDPTDSKGYFHVVLTNIKDLFHCRVKLYTSPFETCNNPTNVNKGLTGVPLSMYGYRYYSNKNLKLFSIGPFYFTGPKIAPATPKY